jgi:predicted transposase/invertase (TIGR01784 family)
MSLLNHILGLKIVNVKYLPTERLGLTEEESKSFFDVYCKDSSGRRYLIEMQMWGQHYFHKRAVYYSSLSVQDQARVEKEYQKMCERVWDYYFAPVYQISFLNFPNTLVEPKEEGNGSPYISHYVYKSKDTGRELGDETNIVFVDLAKFRKKFEECDNQCERWLYSIKNMHLLKSAPIGVAGTELEELYGEAHFAAWTPEKRSLYEKSIMNRNDYENILCERYEDGFAAGIEEGREEGLVLAAKNMIAQGLPIDVIMQVTGLSEAQLEKL